MREENDAAIEQAREETKAMYAAKLAHLKDAAGKNDKALKAALEDQLIDLSTSRTSYRCMLESEETKLNISTDEEATPSMTTYRRTPGTKKRKRDQDDLSRSIFQQSTSGLQVGYQQKSSTKGHIEVFETDTDGKYIKLYNNSDKDESIG